MARGVSGITRALINKRRGVEEGVWEGTEYLMGSKEFRTTRADVCWMHQRCAKQDQKGRVLLAGDALHLSAWGLVSEVAD